MRRNLTVYSGIAILFVVLIHANAYYLHHIKLESTNVLMGLFIDIGHIAVPMFVFVAGYKYELTKKNRDLKRYYKSKINNIIKPTLIISILWIVVFLLLSIIKKIIAGQSVDIMFYIKTLVYRIGQIMIGNNDIYQLWYIPMYIVITFSYPVIQKYIAEYKRILIFLSLAIIQVVGGFNFDILKRHPLDFIYYFIFFEIGILFYRKEKDIRVNRIIIAIIYIGLSILSIYMNEGIFKSIVLKLVIYPIGIVMFYYLSLYFEKSKILNKIGEYAFVIYVLHEPIVLSYIGKIVQIIGWYKTWFWVPVISILGVLLCVCLYKISLLFKLGKFFWNKDNSLYKGKVLNN